MDPTRQSFTPPLPQHCESRDALFTAQVVKLCWDFEFYRARGANGRVRLSSPHEAAVIRQLLAVALPLLARQGRRHAIFSRELPRRLFHIVDQGILRISNGAAKLHPNRASSFVPALPEPIHGHVEVSRCLLLRQEAGRH